MSKNILNKYSGLVEEYKKSPKGLLYIAPTGSGKSLKALQATRHALTTAITPASLTKNLNKEELKFFKKTTPRTTKTYAALSRGHALPGGINLVLDESHNIRNPQTKAFKNIKAQRNKYDKLLLMSATPMYNEPYDIVSQVNLVSGGKLLVPDKKEFYKRHYTDIKESPGIVGRFLGIKPGTYRILKNPIGIRRKLDKITYVVSKNSIRGLMPGKSEETISVPMSDRQHAYYKRLMGSRVPFKMRYKIKKNLIPTKTEARNLNRYLMGVRQLSNTTRAFDPPWESHSPKLDKLVADTKTELKRGGKVLIYSNFLKSGIEPITERLRKNEISYSKIIGSMSKKERSEQVKNYLENKSKVFVYSGAGAEGLNLPKTTLVQITEPYWNKSRTQQAAARGIRRGDDPNKIVRVKKYISVFPKKKKILGFIKRPKKTSVDQYLTNLSNKKNAEIAQLLHAIRDK